MEEKTSHEILEKRIEHLEALERKITWLYIVIIPRLLSTIERRVKMEFEKYSWRWWLYLVIIPAVIAFSTSCLVSIIKILMQH